MTDDLDFEKLVDRFYAALYKFAFSLTQSEAEACDLTQETFYVWASRGHQLRESSKVKSWLFTTLHREFLKKRRRSVRFPHQEINESADELPEVSPDMIEAIDRTSAVAALSDLDDLFRAPLVLFYLKECSYNEIAEVLEIPLGTVKSRIARGIRQLQHIFASKSTALEKPR